MASLWHHTQIKCQLNDSLRISLRLPANKGKKKVKSDIARIVVPPLLLFFPVIVFRYLPSFPSILLENFPLLPLISPLLASFLPPPTSFLVLFQYRTSQQIMAAHSLVLKLPNAKIWEISFSGILVIVAQRRYTRKSRNLSNKRSCQDLHYYV